MTLAYAKSAAPVEPSNPDLHDVIAAYEKLHDACYQQALESARKQDVWAVYLWMRQAIAASNKARKVRLIGTI